MRKYAITASDRAPKGPWSTDRLTWDDVVEWLALDAPADVKECGGYVAGEFTGRRTEESVTSRSMLTLDADTAGTALLADTAMVLDGAWLAHTTWRSTPQAPRWRLLVPLSRDVTPDEHWVIAHAVVAAIGVEHFDLGSAQHERFMYRPAVPEGQRIVSVVEAGDPLDVDEWLSVGESVEPRHSGDGAASGDGGVVEYDEPPNAREIDKAETVLQRAAREIRDGDVTRNNGCIKWLPVLYRFVLGDCLERARVDDVLWTAVQSAPGDADFDEREWATVSASAWSYAETDGPDRPEVPEEPEFDVVTIDPTEVDRYDDYSLADAHIADRIGRDYLRGRFYAWGKTRWASWDGRRWDLWVDVDVVKEFVRLSLVDIVARETARADRRRDDAMRAAQGDAHRVRDAQKGHEARMRAILRLLSAGAHGAIMGLSRGVVHRSLEDFDGEQTHEWLNVGNGMVSLRTGELVPHDPAMLFTQATKVNYVPGAEHPDWKAALTALPDEVARWMQTRFGQAASGKATADDVVPFLKGGGENGKTTVLLGVKRALGDFCKPVPEKVLTAGANDHPTELFTLKGVRLALLEELPGGDFLNVSRLKRVTGTETGMSARPIGQDNVEWDPTHSLMVTTNHDVQIPETDHGTWRRLALVEFPFTFGGPNANRPKDDTLRDRIRDGEDGQWEAALAWVVAGAVRFYRDGLERERDTPERVMCDTRAWQFRANHPARFIDEALVYTGDERECVRSPEVYRMFCLWMEAQGYRRLNEKTFWERAQAHGVFIKAGVKRAQMRSQGREIHAAGLNPLKDRETLVSGVKWGEIVTDFEVGLL